MLLLQQILIDGFAISALYGIGAVGFTLIFGVSGVLNLSHGATMVVAAVVAWLVAGSGLGPEIGGLAGIAASARHRLRHLFHDRPPDPALAARSRTRRRRSSSSPARCSGGS